VSSPQILDYQNFEARELTLHLVYTFLFSSFNLEDVISSTEDEQNLQKKLSTQLGFDAVKFHWSGEDVSLSKRRNSYLDPYLHLKISSIEIEQTVNEAVNLLRWNDQGELYEPSFIEVASLKYKILLLELGQGTLEFEIAFRTGNQELFDVPSIAMLSNLGMRRQKFSEQVGKDDENLKFSEFKLTEGDSEFFFATYFYETVSKVREALVGIFNKELRWIETDPELKLIGDIQKYGTSVHFQDPFPITQLTLPDELYAQSFLDPIQAKTLIGEKSPSILEDIEAWKHNQARISKEVLTILFRSKAFDFPDVSFARSFSCFSNGKLGNMCSTSVVFLQLYSRSGLAIRAESNKSLDHAEYIFPAFIEAVKYLRLRWHTYVILTHWLDKVLEKFYGNNLEPENAIEIVTNVIEIRKEIARSLTDHTTYRTASGSLNIMHELGIRIFRLEELQTIFMSRLGLLDALYNDQKEKLRLSETKVLDEKFKRFEDRLKQT
jgi:hypothetical protein